MTKSDVFSETCVLLNSIGQFSTTIVAIIMKEGWSGLDWSACDPFGGVEALISGEVLKGLVSIYW